MQLNFESLAELQDFVKWVQDQRAAAPIVEGPKATNVVQDLPVVEGSAVDPDETVEDAPPASAEVADKPVRKRRTKAEMEAARAAEAADPATVEPEAVQTESPAVALANTPDSMQDAISFIKSRLVERPEVSQVEHLNLARTFIGKHGMEKYNSSFPLAGLTPNVMGYSPADCATHAAALDFLSLE